MLLHIKNGIYGLDLEVDKPRMNAELRVMMAELYLKSDLTVLKTVPGDIFLPSNGEETSHQWKLKLSQLTEAPGWRGAWVCSLVASLCKLKDA